MANNKIDKEAIQEAYEDVRSDSTETNWLILKHDESLRIGLEATGSDFDEFKKHFTDDERLFGFVRITTGDEMSRRTKFALITWLGHNVGALKKAKMSTDKAFVKEVIRNFAAELLCTEKREVTEENIKQELIKAGGANYGTGHR